jgi:uncharacterized membrane protein
VSTGWPRGGRESAVAVIARRVREQEALRQIRYGRFRRAGLRFVADRLPALLPDFLTTLLGSLVVYWGLAKLLAYLFDTEPLATYAALGLFYSLQASYYTYRLASDPGYKIPACRCAGRDHENSERVLRSRESTLFRLPNSVLAALFYTGILTLVFLGHRDAAMPLAVVAVFASAYLSYVMVVRIAGLCSTCISVAALSVLIFVQLVR